MLVDKALSFFLDPIGLFLTVSATVTFLSRQHLPIRLAGVLVVSLSCLTLAAMPLVANALIKSVEGPYSVKPAQACPVAQVGILLGGALRINDVADLPANTTIAQFSTLASAGDRVRLAFDLLRLGRIKFILISGGNVGWSPALKPEAEHMREMLLGWGARPDQIRLEVISVNTHGNALASREVMHRETWDTALLVTSANHMRRALATFRKAQVPVEPCSADPLSSHLDPLLIFNWLPNADSLVMTATAVREAAGYIVYWARGWI